ncbi:uncharacterized protein JCM6883_006655 [Sporobolomyces salmoneus]|uniref:uncharacterized protein n=1 Tax=Sporobolomyces salmoneus TaxID=183962 RepID=UPI0031777A02
MKFSATLLSLFALPVALAHFTLDYPQTRGFDEDLEPQFCGGFNSPSSSRTPFPLSGQGSILIDSHHPTAQVAVLISFDENPTSIEQFTKLSNGTSYGLLQNFETLNSEGEYCLSVDVASLNLGAVNGTPATIQVEFNGGDGTLFQCSDVVLVSDYSTPSNVTSECQDAKKVSSSSSNASSTSSGSPSPTASGSNGSSPSGTSGAGKIGVAASGFLGVVGIVALAL